MSNPLKNRPRPRTDQIRVNYPIVRCNRSERFCVRALVLSSDVFGVEIHYAGRSHVCTAHVGSCRLCDDGKPTRWVGYVAATSLDLNSLFLLEFTPGVMPDVDQHVKQWKSLRGCWCELTRPSQRDTGRLCIRLNQPFLACKPGELPAPFDLEQTLAKIYGVPQDDEAEKPVVESLAAAVAGQLDLPEMASLSCRPSTVNGEPELDGQLHMPISNGRSAN